MNTCPHCGAALREHARFCPACMTSLVNKQVIPTPKYAPKRWLSATVAVFVLCAAVGAVWIMPPRPADAPVTAVMDTTIAPAATTEVPTTTVGEVPTSSSELLAADGGTTTLTTLAETFGEHPTDTTTVTHNTWRPTYDTTGRVPPFLTTTTGKVTTHSSTTTKTTTTKKTTTTAPPPTYPAAWNTVYRNTTEDGLPIEEVKWTYKSAGEQLYLSYYQVGGGGPWGYFSRQYTQTICYKIPMSQCIILTGFDAPTSNGIYRIPAAIDGKVVVGVDMRSNVAGARHFNDADIAPTVKRIYLPPELLVIYTDTINQCTAMERMYFGCDTIWLEPDALPVYGNHVYMYSHTFCYMSCSSHPYDLPILKNYCVYTDEGAGATLGKDQYYSNTTWRLSNFAYLELYD